MCDLVRSGGARRVARLVDLLAGATTSGGALPVPAGGAVALRRAG